MDWWLSGPEEKGEKEELLIKMHKILVKQDECL